MTHSPVEAAAHVRGEPPLDQKLALDAAAARLLREFGDQVDEETVDQLLHSAYDRVASHAKVETFLPLLAERYTRERLQTRAESASG
ncbi:three-helix bundle dimerization domain-containing protein [Nocardia sp. NPDC050406]|uniref:three-helix bundle dimerization domain-containing protein n=1 Tax=Nocardia sp. NPDC050406 TaxID=3364318 RepID=UPI003797A92F